MIAESQHLDAKQFEKQYKHHLSDFESWDQLSHAEDWLLFPQNLGTNLSIDETTLSNGELYTIVTNKAAKGRKGAVLAIIKGTKAKDICHVLARIPFKERLKVAEVTLDMANNMEWIVRETFKGAVRVTDRFHVQKLVSEALQEIRVKLRWEAIERENQAIAAAQQKKLKYEAPLYSNGDTEKQLLARSRYLLFKPRNRWTESQQERSGILFAEFSELEEGYNLSMMFRSFYEHSQDKEQAREKLQAWYTKVQEQKKKFPSFCTAAESIKSHEPTILAYFHQRSTNAAAESFNAKIKGFRALVRGVSDKKVFLFRISQIYA